MFSVDRFDGTRCKGKPFFLLTVLKIAYVLDPKFEPLPKPKEDDSDAVNAMRKKREEDEVMCRGHILNTLSNRLHDFYNSMESSIKI